MQAGKSEFQVLREQNSREVRLAGAEVAGKVFVDKHPLHSLKLPAIGRLCPKAKFLFVHRDPRDVVLSCFGRHFIMNPATYQVLLTLEGASAFYDVTMRLTDTAQFLLGLHWQAIRHEDLVTVLDRQLCSVCSFLGLEWVPGPDSFADQAQARLRNRPDIRHWRHYRTMLKPILPTLDPWVKRLEWG